MFHSLLATWFHLSLAWGYPGIFLMMAIESTVFPLPSEVVIPPAAYWAEQGHLSFWGVVIAGTLGSWFGATLSYAVARWLGRPILIRYGKYVFVPAGAARMRFRLFSLSTLLGSFLWCTVLAWFGARVLADQPRLLEDPQALSHVLREKLVWLVAGALVLLALYFVVDTVGRRLKHEDAAATTPPSPPTPRA